MLIEKTLKPIPKSPSEIVPLAIVNPCRILYIQTFPAPTGKKAAGVPGKNGMVSAYPL